MKWYSINRRTEFWLMIVVFAVLLALYVATLYPGQNWGGDFAQYIHQAINLVEGVDMADTGYIYNPYTPVLGPRAYPAGFPILLAPTYALFGFQIVAFQAELLLLQFLAVIVSYLLYRRELSVPTASILAIVVGLSPYLILYKNSISSEIPFLLFLLLFTLLIEHVYARESFGGGNMALAIFLAFFCSIIRTVGLVIPVALIISDLLRWRRPRRFSLLVLAGVVVLLGLTRLVLGGGESSYFDQLSDYDFAVILQSLDEYLTVLLPSFWAGPSLNIAGRSLPILYLFSLVLMVYGLIHRRKQTFFIPIFIVLFGGTILIWPFREPRFLYAIFPLLFLYVGIGFEAAVRQLARVLRVPYLLPAAVLVFALGLLTIYAVRTQKIIREGDTNVIGPYQPDSVEMFDFVMSETAPDAVFIFFKPRVLSLYADRSASTYPLGQEAAIVIEYFEDVQPDYMIIYEPDAPIYAEMAGFVADYPAAFDLVFDNDSFDIYEVEIDSLDTSS